MIFNKFLIEKIAEETYGVSELDGSQGDNGDAEVNGDGFTHYLSGGAHNTGLPGSHSVPTSGVQQWLPNPIFHRRIISGTHRNVAFVVQVSNN